MQPVRRHTIYDVMEARGDFRHNPANAGSVAPDGSQLYEGPVPFPRMVYAAEEEVIVPGTWEETPRGPKFLGEQRALVNKIVRSKEEYEAALASGWYDHPAKALGAVIEANRAKGVDDPRVVPLVSAQATIDSYKREIEELREKLAKAEERSKIGRGDGPAPRPPPKAA